MICVDVIQYQFQVNPVDEGRLLPQVSQALKVRTEFVSRKRYPKLWRHTDKWNAASRGRRRSRLRTRGWSAICLALGVFLLIPGLVEPEELPVPLLTGALAIGAGIGGLWRSRKSRKNPFDLPAEKLLSGRSSALSGQYQVSFSAQEMLLAEQAEEKTERVPYGEFECAVEGEDLFLLFFRGRVILLMKRDLLEGSLGDFRDFLSERVSVVPAE
jgi:hypothetical protein